MKGRLHNIYVTPDGKHLITGSIPAKLMTVIDLEREVPVWELRSTAACVRWRSKPPPTARPRRIFVQLSDTNGFAVVDFAARKEVARIKLPDDEDRVRDRSRARHVRRRTASASRPTTRRCG